MSIRRKVGWQMNQNEDIQGITRTIIERLESSTREKSARELAEHAVRYSLQSYSDTGLLEMLKVELLKIIKQESEEHK